MNQDVNFGDLHSLTTYDGKTLVFDNQEIALLAYGGYGAPPTDFQTRRGYKQHGATEMDYTLNVRTISVIMWAQKSCSRADYWQLRAQLHDYLSANRGGPLTLTLRRPDNSKRAIRVRATPGLQFPMLSTDADIWQIEEQIDFVAFDPVWFDPTGNSLEVLPTFDQNLVFPITFPIIFGTEGAVFDAIIDYEGSWVEYPTLTLSGPYTSAIIENVETGVKIFMVIGIGASDQRIITLTPGMQSVVDQFGENKFGELGPTSNLVEFNIRPDPLVQGGSQTIRAQLLGATTTSASGYYTAVINDMPRRYYRLGEIAGDAADSGSDQANGTYINSPMLGVDGALPGDTNKAVALDGIDQIVSVPTIALAGLSFTLEAWIQPSIRFIPAFQGVLTIYSTASTGGVVQIILYSTGEINLSFFASDILTPAGTVQFDNSWYHIVCTYDAGTDTSVIYVNGVQEATGNNGPFTGLAPSVSIGTLFGGLDYFKGIIDEVAIYDRVLLAAEVLEHYDARTIEPSIDTDAGFQVDYYAKYVAI